MDIREVLKILIDPTILIVAITFGIFSFYYLKKVNLINRDLMLILSFLKTFKKSDLPYRFKELDNGMSSAPFVSNLWADFKNTLMFSESFSTKNEHDDIIFQDISQSIANVQTTVDPVVFFNDETLITSRMNYKFIQAMPTILTGLGPLFTFLHIGIAFSCMNFSNPEATLGSISKLMGSMQIAATVSVLAVSASLLFLLLEKVSWNSKCKQPLQSIQEQFNKLFESISSEKFLIELLRETKIQNNNTKNLLSVMPANFKSAMDQSMSNILVPYLETLVFGINKLQEKVVVNAKQNSDIVDELF